MRAFVLPAAGIFCAVLLTGCGTSPATGCDNVWLLTVTPATGSASHAAPTPGNQFQFYAGAKPAAGNRCALDNVVHATYAAWTSSDPVDATVSSAADESNGTVKCINATAQPITLTAVATPQEYTENGAPAAGAQNQSVTVTLTCK